MMNKRRWRKVHRSVGLFLLGFLLLYSLTGLLLNHRKAFGYFQTRHERAVDIKIQQPDVLSHLMETYRQQIGREDAPTVIRVKEKGIIEFLYGTHGSTTYVIDSLKGNAICIEKKDTQPLYWLNSLHKSYKVAAGWVWLTDGIALLILLLAVSGLIIFHYTWLDILLIALGGLVMVGGMITA